MKKYFLLTAVAMIATMSWGQSVKIAKAQDLLTLYDQKQDEQYLMEARATIAEAIASPKTKDMAFAYNVAGQIEMRLFSKNLDKYILKADLDTTAFIQSLDNTINYFTKSYEIDHSADEKGKVKVRYDYGTEKEKYTIGQGNGNVENLKKIFSNYLMSAQLEYSRGNKASAYEYYMKHLNMPKHPIFTPAQTDSIYKSDDRYPIVGYYATIIAFQDKDYDKVLQTVNYALQSEDETTREDGYHMKTTALLHKGDTAQWISTLKDAMENTTNVNYPQIILKYYYDKHNQAEASKIANEFVAKSPGNKMAHYIKGVVLMDEGKDAEARACFEKAVEIDENFVDAISNIGVTLFNEVRELNQKATTDNKAANYKTQQQELKEKLLNTKTYFERVQALAPERSDLWQSKLDNINNLIEIVDNNLAEVAKRDKK